MIKAKQTFKAGDKVVFRSRSHFPFFTEGNTYTVKEYTTASPPCEGNAGGFTWAAQVKVTASDTGKPATAYASHFVLAK